MAYLEAISLVKESHLATVLRFLWEIGAIASLGQGYPKTA
jgi:hypothetical protein